MSNIYRFDANGTPFKFPSLFLDQREYAKITTEIDNLFYELYCESEVDIHYSVGTDDKYYIYYFESHGFNDYNIFKKELILD